MSDFKVVHILNSIYGKSSNIGYRTSIINQLLSKLSIDWITFGRGSAIKTSQFKPVQLLGALIPRAMNYYRMKFDHTFNHRKFDLNFFESMFLLRYKSLLASYEPKTTLIHLWEPCHRIIDLCHELGFKVILEIPIAPEKTGEVLVQQGLYGKIQYIDNEIDEGKAFSSADYLLLPSKFVKTEIVKFYNIDEKKLVVVPFGAHLGLEKKYSKINPKSIQFGFAGGTSPRKGLHYLLQSFDSDFDKDALHICGRIYKDSMVKKSNILFYGHVDIEKYFTKFDVYVFPTLMEGSSKSVYEAMAAGIPVITTPNAGSIIEDGKDGFIVPVGDVKALKEKMQYFKDNPDEIVRMGKNGREKIANGFLWEDYAQRVADVYKTLLKENKR